MIVVRVVQTGDVDALVALAQETGPGLTSFKPDRAALAARIGRTCRTLEEGIAFLKSVDDTVEWDKLPEFVSH